MGNLTEFILSRTVNYKSLPAFISKENNQRSTLTYDDFNDLVLKISAYFQKQFPQENFRVGLWGENRVEWCALAYGIWHAGGTLVPLMHIATKGEVQNIIQAAELDALFFSEKMETLENISFPHLHPMKLSGPGGIYDLTADLTPASSSRKGEIAVLIFTSGTTGNPKGVLLTHQNIMSNISDTVDILPGKVGERAVSILPLAHMFEMVCGFTMAHMKGVCISYPDSLKPEDVLNELKVHKSNWLISVPLFFEIIDRAIQEKLSQLPKPIETVLNALKPLTRSSRLMARLVYRPVHQVFGGHIKYFVSGGAKIDPEVLARFEDLGIQVLQGYGLTETAPIISFTRPNKNRFGSVGQALPSVKVKIHAPDSKGEGEICVQGPNVFQGYLNDTEATQKVLKDQWFHTGDIGRIDDEGFLFITGRQKDLIVTPNGKNVYPEEIENLLKNSPLFLEVCVLGVDVGKGEEVYGIIVPATGVSAAKVSEEIDRLSQDLADYKKIKKVIVTTSELPKTATKKIRKHLVKQMLATGELQSDSAENLEASTPLDTSDPIQVWLGKEIETITKKPDVYLDSHLRNHLGLDSLTFMELIGKCESKWGITIPDENFESILTFGDLAQQIKNGQPSKPSKKTFVFDYRQNNTWYMNSLRLFVQLVFLRLFVKTYFGLKTSFAETNKEDIFGTSNFIITPNHTSHLDLISILTSIPLSMVNKTYGVAADDYFFKNKFKAFFVRLFFNAVPFERKARIDKGFKVCEDILKDGGNLVIFPEGTRSVSGKLDDFKPGIGRLLTAGSYRAIPTVIKGAYEAFPKGVYLPRPGKISITFMSSSQYDPEEDYKVIANELQEKVASGLFT